MMPPNRRLRVAALIALATACLGASVAGQDRVSLTQQVLAHPDFNWRTTTGGGVRLHWQPGTFAERHRIMLLRSAGAAIAQGLDFLGLSDYARELNVFYVDSRQQMERLVGRPVTGYSDWTGSGVFLVCNPDWRSFDTHEIAHVLSIGQWGWPTQGSRWMIEGLPIAVDGWCQDIDIDTIAHYLIRSGMWPGLERFPSEYADLGEIPAGVLAASLIRYLRAEYGPKAIRQFWLDGPAEFASSRDLDLERLEAGWRSYLDRVAEPMSEAAWERVDAEGCG